MLEPIKPKNEKDRLNALKALEILDTPEEERFSRITRIAKTFFDVDIATISLVDAERQWFKGMQGLEVCQTPRNVSFCGHTILKDELLVVNDTHKDKRFFDNPLVEDAPYIRFYAGAPVHSPSGFRIGTLCIIHTKPMTLNHQQKHFLQDLASWVDVELGFKKLNSVFSELKDSRARLKLATQSAKIGVWDWEIASNKLIWDERMYALYGINKADFSGAYEAWENGVHPEDRAQAALDLKNAIKHNKDFDTEFRVCWPDKSVHYIKAFGKVLHDAHNVALNVIGVNWDITLQKEQEAKIQALTFRDDLTGLYNRRGFRMLAEQNMKEANRLQQNTALLLADINQMKRINDDHGHIIGDKALVATAHLLKISFRETDIICRWGGDEFVILVVNAASKDLTALRHRLEANIRQYNLKNHEPFQLEISIGEFIKDNSLNMSLETLIQEADTKMYEIKNNQ